MSEPLPLALRKFTSFLVLSYLAWLRGYHRCGTFGVAFKAIPPPYLSELVSPKRPKWYCLRYVYSLCIDGPSLAEGLY